MDLAGAFSHLAYEPALLSESFLEFGLVRLGISCWDQDQKPAASLGGESFSQLEVGHLIINEFHPSDDRKGVDLEIDLLLLHLN